MRQWAGASWKDWTILGRAVRGNQDFLHLLPSIGETWPDFRALVSNYVGPKRLRYPSGRRPKPELQRTGYHGGGVEEGEDCLGLKSIWQPVILFHPL